MRADPEPVVLEWANGLRPRDAVTTVISVLELMAGLERLASGRRRAQIAKDIEWVLDEVLGGRVIVLDRRAAVAASAWLERRRRSGTSVDIRDAMIAGIAIARHIPLATRNVEHFSGLDVKVVNPWSS